MCDVRIALRKRDPDLYRSAVAQDYSRVYDYIQRSGIRPERQVERLVDETFELVAFRVWRLLEDDELRFSDIWLAAAVQVLDDYFDGLERIREQHVPEMAAPTQPFSLWDDEEAAAAAEAAALDRVEREFLYLLSKGFSPGRIAASKGAEPGAVFRCCEIAVRRFEQELLRRELEGLADADG